jgi:MoxR-like ATPase
VIGASVRGSLALERAARAAALLRGRTFVVPADVEKLILPVLGHRIAFTPATLAEARRIGVEATLDEFRNRCLAEAPPPRLELHGAEP